MTEVAPARVPSYAAIAVTRGGAALGARLQAALPELDLWVAARWAEAEPATASAPTAAAPSAPPGRRVPFTGSPAALIGDLFARYTGLIFLLAVGGAVRLIAPHLRDKHTDPAVVAVDDCGQWAVPILSGHLGGANALARQVAAALGAQAVITTASDVQGTLAVDLLGQEFGWRIADFTPVTGVSAAVVNGEPVAVYQDAGERHWGPADAPRPANLRPVGDLAACAAYPAGLIITDRAEIPAGLPAHTVLYRPRSLVVGVGCNRGTAAAEIGAAVAQTLAAAGLAAAAVRNWASINAKADEPGLLAAARAEGLELAFFAKEPLNAVTVPNPSAAPLRYVGAQGVAEPAALVSAGAGAELVVPKQKLGNCTVAVARIPFNGGAHT